MGGYGVGRLRFYAATVMSQRGIHEVHILRATKALATRRHGVAFERCHLKVHRRAFSPLVSKVQRFRLRAQFS